MSSNKRKQNKPQRSLEQCELDENPGCKQLAEVPQSTRRSRRIVSKMMSRSPSPPASTKLKKKQQSPKKPNTKKKLSQPQSSSKSKKGKQTDDSVLNVDVLRRMPVTELVDKFAAHSTKQIPKDKQSTIVQHVYSCQMMPHNCREVFCGSASDTMQEIRRHLLRHIGELLTLTNLDPDSKKAKSNVNITTVKRQPLQDASKISPKKFLTTPEETEMEEQQDITKQERRSQRILAKVLNRDGKPQDNEKNKFTIIHSDEGVNELVLLPKGKLINLSSISDTGDDPEESITAPSEKTRNVVSTPLNNIVDLPKEEVKPGRQSRSLQRNISSEVIMESVAAIDNYISGEIDADQIGAEIVVQTCMQAADELIAAMETVPFSPPHIDHLYALLPCKPLPISLHTDSSGVPIPEPEQSNHEGPEFSQEEVVEECPQVDEVPVKPSTADIESVEIVTDFDMDSVCQDIDTSRGKKKRKQDPQLAVINYELFQHLTPDERRIRKQALELLYQSRKRSRIKKGELLECQICGKMLTAFGTLRAHYRSHAGIKPYSCKVCSATFTRLHSLKYHMMIHNDQSRFTCEHCGREFRHASHFREHLRRHTGEEPFGCTECSARFKTRNTYKRHLYAKHGKVLRTDGIHLARVHQTMGNNKVAPDTIYQQDTVVHDTAFQNPQTQEFVVPSTSDFTTFAQQIVKDEQEIVSPSQDDTEDIASCLASLSEITNPLRDMEGNIRILLIN
ncbi:zinc finger and BTB domain-containing protein 11-like isoform X2 [Anneissia japonica]|uniref:zinc finger and BTB domain-containing protein 11-like isoform X2 n=1 Tax=Anneissia japonica TaxID=1529436 RepID=UPI0014258B33|nr:zinc finger and BTB domain-containing protein 11-like isoform X2 [Anneissia japonica]